MAKKIPRPVLPVTIHDRDKIGVGRHDAFGDGRTQPHPANTFQAHNVKRA